MGLEWLIVIAKPQLTSFQPASSATLSRIQFQTLGFQKLKRVSAGKEPQNVRAD